jgi:hypothetical protein
LAVATPGLPLSADHGGSRPGLRVIHSSKCTAHNAAFAESFPKGDASGVAFDALATHRAPKEAAEVARLEHPELEKLDEIAPTLKQLAAPARILVCEPITVLALLGFITRKLWQMARALECARAATIRLHAANQFAQGPLLRPILLLVGVNALPLYR